MTQVDILQELNKFTALERLKVIEAAIHQIRKELDRTERKSNHTHQKAQLARAAKALLHDYETNDELVAFTMLDSEDFHE